MRLTCWQNQGAALYELLAHHLKVAAGTESVVHGPPIEGRLQKRLAPRHALKGDLDVLAFVFAQAPGALPLQNTETKPTTRSRSDQAS